MNLNPSTRARIARKLVKVRHARGLGSRRAAPARTLMQLEKRTWIALHIEAFFLRQSVQLVRGKPVDTGGQLLRMRSSTFTITCDCIYKMESFATWRMHFQVSGLASDESILHHRPGRIGRGPVSRAQINAGAHHHYCNWEDCEHSWWCTKSTCAHAHALICHECRKWAGVFDEDDTRAMLPADLEASFEQMYEQQWEQFQNEKEAAQITA
jgi:hypothetical protein